MNFQSNTAENAPLQINVNNPYLTAQNRAVLSSVGITGATPATSNFIITRQNQDIFGDNPFQNLNETFRLVNGLRADYSLFGKNWNAEVSATYGRGVTTTRATQINDIEYQLALDAVDLGLAAGGPANGNIVCRAKLFPGQYLGRSPIGTTANIVRQRNGAGALTESLFTPTITQSMIDSAPAAQSVRLQQHVAGGEGLRPAGPDVQERFGADAALRFVRRRSVQPSGRRAGGCVQRRISQGQIALHLERAESVRPWPRRAFVQLRRVHRNHRGWCRGPHPVDRPGFPAVPRAA